MPRRRPAPLSQGSSKRTAFFGGCNPVNDSLRRLEIGGSLGSGELLRICKLLETAGRAKAYGRHDNADDTEDCLDSYFAQLNPVSILTTEIRRCIIEEDEISDEASPALKHIRRQMAQINDKVHATLSGMVNGSLRTYLQDPIITMRGDRYRIPVKAEYRSQVPGMIHDQSSTGSTLFIEPMAVVKLNNDLKRTLWKRTGRDSGNPCALKCGCCRIHFRHPDRLHGTSNTGFYFCKGITCH